MSMLLFTPWSPQAERSILHTTLEGVRDANLHPYHRFYICAAVQERLQDLDGDDHFARAGLPHYVDYYYNDAKEHAATRGLWARLTGKLPKVNDDQKRLAFFLRAVKRLQDLTDKKRKPMDWRKLLLVRRDEVPNWQELLAHYGILSPLVICLAGVTVPGVPTRMIPHSVRTRAAWFPPQVYSLRASTPYLSIYWDAIKHTFPLADIDKDGMIRGELTLDELFINYINTMEDCMTSYDNLVPYRIHVNRLPFRAHCDCQRYRAMHWMLGMEQPPTSRGNLHTPDPSPSPSLLVTSPSSSRSSSPPTVKRDAPVRRRRW